jgi:hypothetical protein
VASVLFAGQSSARQSIDGEVGPEKTSQDASDTTTNLRFTKDFAAANFQQNESRSTTVTQSSWRGATPLAKAPDMGVGFARGPTASQQGDLSGMLAYHHSILCDVYVAVEDTRSVS